VQALPQDITQGAWDSMEWASVRPRYFPFFGEPGWPADLPLLFTPLRNILIYGDSEIFSFSNSDYST